MNDAQLIESIKELYGSEITTGDLKGFCASRGLNYQTVTRRLEDYKTGRGRWNLEVTPSVVGKMEQAYQAPAALPAIEQNLIPEKDDTFV
ncbi:MAG: MoxR family ATPase, partial [Candidatus Nanopelagicales bacterium]